MQIKDVADTVRDRISEKGMTIKAVAGKAGITPQALSAMLRHKQNIPATVFISLCAILDFTPNDFVTEKEGE